jgi:hypothetical protein
MLWTAILHDMIKRASPMIKTPDDRDPSHPFRSCHEALKFLNEHKLVKLSD